MRQLRDTRKKGGCQRSLNLLATLRFLGGIPLAKNFAERPAGNNGAWLEGVWARMCFGVATFRIENGRVLASPEPKLRHSGRRSGQPKRCSRRLKWWMATGS